MGRGLSGRAFAKWFGPRLLTDDHEDDDHEEHEDHDVDEAEHKAVAPILILVVALFLGVLCKTVPGYFSCSIPKTDVVIRGDSLPFTVLMLVLGIVCEAISYRLEQVDYPGFDESIWNLSLSQWTRINPHLVLFAFLPILIFESAFAANWYIFQHQIGQILLLAVPGVLLCTSLTACVLHGLPFDVGHRTDDESGPHDGLGSGAKSWNICFLFGAMLSATDPVAVVALMKELGTSKRLATLIEGESLLNDGTSIVLFDVFLTAYLAGVDEDVESLDNGGIIEIFFQLAFGGAAIGLCCAEAVRLMWHRMYNNSAAEITLSFVAAYGTFFIAESANTSGVLALVVLGIYLSAVGKLQLEPETLELMNEFWELLADFANTIIFFIAGSIVYNGFITKVITKADWGLLIALYFLLHLIRSFMLLLFAPVLRLSFMGYGLSAPEGVACAYGGLRGAVGLALALIIDEDTRFEKETRDLAMFLMSGIAFLTLAVNGTTTGQVLAFVGLTKVGKEQRNNFEVNAGQLASEVLEELEENITNHEFLGGVNLAEVVRYMPMHSPETYVEISERFGLSSTDENIPDRLKGRWARYQNRFGWAKAGPQYPQRNPLAAEVVDMDDSTGGIEMRSEKQRSRSRAASVRIKKGRLQREQLDLKKVKADMRIRFTRALKTKFYGLIEEGYLESSRGFFMLLMTDYMLDDDMVNSKLDSFGHAKKMLDSTYLRILVSPAFEMFRNNKWCRGIAKMIEHEAMSYLYEASSSFIMAHKNAEALLKSHTAVYAQDNLHEQDAWIGMVTDICEESKTNIEKMQQYFEQYRHFSSEIIESIKVKAAARVMLTIEREKVRILRIFISMETTALNWSPKSCLVLSPPQIYCTHSSYLAHPDSRAQTFGANG
jgi:NhaP-type Na+/H+ or K+/H+ antiporter